MVLRIFAHNFLNIQPIINPQKSFGKLRVMAFQPYHQILSILKHIRDVEGYFYLQHLQHASIYISVDGMVEMP